MNMEKIGNQIATLRKQKKLTQTDLGERLGVSFQAVSKWERGETLPDTAILLDLASVLETTVDFILSGGEKALEYKGKISVENMIKGLNHLKEMGICLGQTNLLYRAAIDGINSSLNANIEDAFADEYVFEAFVAEAVIQNLLAGAYVDVTDVKNSFSTDHFKNIVLDFCKKCNII